MIEWYDLVRGSGCTLVVHVVVRPWPLEDQPVAPYFLSLQLGTALAGPVKLLPVQYTFGGVAAFAFGVDSPYEALNSPLQA